MKKFFAYLIAAVMFFTVSGAEKMNIRYPSVAKVMAKARKGGEITVVFFGGSLTFGANASDPGVTSFRALVMEMLRQKYPEAKWRFYDAAIGGTGSTLAIFRMERDIFRRKPDLVILDFTLNDILAGDAEGFTGWKNGAYEMILRQCLSRNTAVLPVFLAAQEHVTEPDISRWKRRMEHLELFEKYRLEYADILKLMHRDFAAGKLDIAKIWEPELFDTIHPHDCGYAVYAEYFKSEWERIEALPEKTPVLPPSPLCGNHFDNFTRVEAVSLDLPGWQKCRPWIVADSFDWMASRWIDFVAMQGNCSLAGLAELKCVPDKKLRPLTLEFQAETIALMVETLPESVGFTVSIDGGTPRRIRGRRVLRSQFHYLILGRNLDPHKLHTLHIVPETPEAGSPGVMRWGSFLLNGAHKCFIRVSPVQAENQPIR